MSTQLQKLLAVQQGPAYISRHNSYGSSQSSGQESYGSANETNTRSEGSSRQTPSEYSLPTPDDEQPDIDQFYFGMDGDSPAFTLDNTRIKRLSDDSNAGQQSLSYIKPEMLASLTTQYDYKMNRYSSVTGVSDLQQFDEVSEDEESEGGEEFDVDFEEDDFYSPIEIARPVSLVIPLRRPAVVSISTPRSPTFPSSVHDSFSRSSLDSGTASSHSRSSSIDKTSTPASQEPVYTSEEEDQIHMTEQASQRVPNAPSAIPPRKASTRMNSLKKLIRTTSSQLLDIKEEGAYQAPQITRRDSTASSIYSRVSEAPRSFDLGAFITSQPVLRGAPGPALAIPTRSTSRRHSKDFTTSPTAPTLTPRNPRRNLMSQSTVASRNGVAQETWL